MPAPAAARSSADSLSARPRQLAVDARLHGAAVGAGAHGARPARASRKREGVTAGRVHHAGITVAASCEPLVDRIGADADQYSDILARSYDEERAVAARVGESWPTNKAALLPQGLASRSGLQCSRGLCESAKLGWLQELEQERLGASGQGFQSRWRAYCRPGEGALPGVGAVPFGVCHVGYSFGRHVNAGLWEPHTPKAPELPSASAVGPFVLGVHLAGHIYIRAFVLARCAFSKATPTAVHCLDIVQRLWLRRYPGIYVGSNVCNQRCARES